MTVGVETLNIVSFNSIAFDPSCIHVKNVETKLYYKISLRKVFTIVSYT